MKTVLTVATGALALFLAGPISGPKVVTNSVGMRLVRVPAGTFSMGSPESEPERDAEEIPHEVSIHSFYLGAHEVTQRQYETVMKRHKQRRPSIFNASRGGGPDHPVESVLWAEAREFCRRLSALPEEKQAGRRYRLPTEAEWEYACRAGTTTPFHHGANLSATQANFNGGYPYGETAPGTYLRRTAQVGSYAPNAFGLFDMHGNVAEWCADYYDRRYYEVSPRDNPPGPPEGVLSTDYDTFYRVVRGGSWLDDGRALRSAYRFCAMPANRYRIIGLRVVFESGDDL